MGEGGETITIDVLDRRLIHALGVDGRLPFRRIAEVLGSSEQTVARRYRRLREAGVIRVVVLRNPRRFRENLFLRIRTSPGTAAPLGDALARRSDVAWVTLTAGATEVTCALRSDDPGDRDALIVESLPRVGRVTDISAATLLHVFGDGPLAEWHALEDPLTEGELDALGGRSRRGTLEAGADATFLTPEDDELLALLAHDGRMTYAALAAATGRNEAAVARRIDALLERRTLFVDIEVASKLLDFRTAAMLWLTVPPAELAAVGEQIAVHPEVAFTGAVSGPANLAVAVTCRDSPHLYRYLTGRLGAIPAISQYEVVLAVRHIKQAGTVMDGDRLPDPTASAAGRPRPAR